MTATPAGRTLDRMVPVDARRPGATSKRAQRARARWKAYDYADRLDPAPLALGPKVLAPPSRPDFSRTKKNPRTVHADDPGA